MMPPKKDTQKTEKGASLEQSTHGQAELLTIDQKGKKDNVEGNGQASGQEQVGSTTEEEGPSLTDMVIIDANDASVEAGSPDSTIQPKNGQNQDGNGDEHFQVEPDDKNESGTDGNVELEEQPNRQGKPVDSTGQTPLTSTNNDNEKTPNASVQTNTSNRSPTHSFSGNTPSMMTADTNMKGNTTRERKEVKHAKQPGSSKKTIARGGGGQTTCHGEAGNTNKEPSQSMDSSGNSNTDDALSQANVPKSKEKVPYGAQNKDEKTYCSHFKTVWGLRLDLLLLTIGVVIAAVILRLPFGAKEAIENPAIQKQLKDLENQFTKHVIEVNSTMKDLKSEVNKHSDINIEQSKLQNIYNEIKKINDILSPTDPNDILYPDIKTKVREMIKKITKSQTDIVDVQTTYKRESDKIQSDLSAFKQEQIQSDSNLSTDITNIRDNVTKNIEAHSTLSGYVTNVEKELNYLKSNFTNTTSKVEAINETVSEVIKNSRTAEKKVEQTNENLETVHEHLFNKGALTAVILILFILIIGLMLYVLKLKSSLEPSLAGGSTNRPLKGSRGMEVVLQKMPSRPTLENAVCIVSFYASNSDEYKRMIKETVGQLGEVSFRTHVIRKHADIAELPHCRLYIMCVEFTERHVIIEEQGLGLGDLKLTSYRGVRNLGGALVILYIHDPGSRRLTDDQLYSDGVYCVKKQQELKELCEIDRFISAHNKLNTAQKKALETAISRVLTIQATRH